MLPCWSVIHPDGYLCGCVGVPKEHPYYDVDPDEIPFQPIFYEGLSFSPTQADHIWGQPSCVWWFIIQFPMKGPWDDVHAATPIVEALAQQLYVAGSP